MIRGSLVVAIQVTTRTRRCLHQEPLSYLISSMPQGWPCKSENTSSSQDQERTWTLADSIHSMNLLKIRYYCILLPQLQKEILDSMASIQQVELKTDTHQLWHNSEKITLQGISFLITYETDSNPQDILKSSHQNFLDVTLLRDRVVSNISDVATYLLIYRFKLLNNIMSDYVFMQRFFTSIHNKLRQTIIR